MQFPVTHPSRPPRQVLPVPAKVFCRVGVTFREVTRLSHHGVAAYQRRYGPVTRWCRMRGEQSPAEVVASRSTVAASRGHPRGGPRRVRLSRHAARTMRSITNCPTCASAARGRATQNAITSKRPRWAAIHNHDPLGVTCGGIPPSDPSASPSMASLHPLRGVPSLGCGLVSQY